MSLLGFEFNPVTVGLVVVAAYLIWSIIKPRNHWKRMGVPEPWIMPVLGQNVNFVISSQQEIEMKWLKKYGKIYGTYQSSISDGGKPQLTVADPDMIKQVLVKDFLVFNNRRQTKLEEDILEKSVFRALNDNWKRLRAIITPTFSSGKIKKMYSLISDCSKYCLDNLESHAKQKKDVDLKNVYGCLTMDVIAKCAFGTDTNANEDKNNPFVVHARGIFKFSIWRLLFIIVMPAFVLKMFGIKSIGKEEHNNFFLDVTRHVMKKRRETNEKRNDLLQLLMDSQLDENSNESVEKEKDYESHHLNEGEEELKAEKKALNVNIVNKKLSEDEILAQAWVFFLAGYETTATTLSYCTYELAINPDVQDKLLKELQSTPKNGDVIDYENLAKLPYLDAVVSETLRKYPPVLRLERRAGQRYKFEGTNIVLDAGDLVEIPVYAIQHSEEFYPEPEQFKPERFLPENRHQIKPFTYLPFGTGPRNCVGMRFGLLEVKLTLAKAIPKYRFVRCANTDVPLVPVFKSGLYVSKRIIVDIEKRY